MNEETIRTPEKEELLKIGVIGTGNCGGQMTDLAAGEGFDGMVINASSKDLSLLKNRNLTLIPVGDGKGTGKNRDEAKKFFIQRINLVQDAEFMKFIENHDVIVIPTSIGGGFGAGSSLVLADVLQKITEGNKVIIPVGVMPFDDELYTAQNHAIAWLKELEELEMSYILYDNNNFSKLPKAEACAAVNKQFVEDLRVIRGDFLNETVTGGIDNRDMLTALSIPGRLVIDTIPLLEKADVIDDSIITTIQQHIKDTTAHAEMVDDKVIKASALMYSLRDEFNAFKPGLKSEMQTIFGMHINDYDNFSDLDIASDIPDTVSLILVGLSAPALRINRMISRRDKLEQDILAQKSAASKLESTTSGSDALKVTAKSFGSAETKKSGKDVSEFLAGYIKSNTK